MVKVDKEITDQAMQKWFGTKDEPKNVFAEVSLVVKALEDMKESNKNLHDVIVACISGLGDSLAEFLNPTIVSKAMMMHTVSMLILYDAITLQLESEKWDKLLVKEE